MIEENALRYRKNACTDPDKINDFLTKSRIGYLGLADQKSPYVVPVNFVWKDGKIYFHGAESGRKASILKPGAQACFTVAAEYATLTDPVPSHASTAYFSVMLFGKAAPIGDLSEKTAALQLLLNKYLPGYYKQPLASQLVEKYRSSLGSATFVFCLKPDRITAKEHPLDPQRAFFKNE